MTETDLIPAISATPLAQLLASTGASPQLADYHGALTARELDAPQKETVALLSGVAVHDLGWLRRVAVLGQDRLRWLSGMVTNMVNDLPANTGAWNLVLNAQGRIQGDLHVWRDGDQLELEIAADQYEKLLAHLDRFIIMDDVELVPLNDETPLGLCGPQSGEFLARLGLPSLDEPLTTLRTQWNGVNLRLVRAYGVLVPHYQLWVQAIQLPALWKTLIEAGATPVGTTSLEALRIAEAIPTYGIDMVERDLPQETSQMRTLSFSKGCYLGQEIVERIRSRGNVHRHLRQLELSGPLPVSGAELTFQNAAGADASAGQITSAVNLPAASRILALAMIRGEAELRNQPFTYSVDGTQGTARILATPPILEVKQQRTETA